MKDQLGQFPPYTGTEPYICFAFSPKDSAKAKKILRLLYERGCRVWYSCKKADGAADLLIRQKRALDASLTLLYLSDAACQDVETKSNLLVYQNREKPILCLSPDGKDRKLSMGLLESVPLIRLDQCGNEKELQSGILHAEGFSQDLLGEPVLSPKKGWIKTLPLVFLIAALLLTGVFLYRFVAVPAAAEEEQAIGEVVFSDPLIREAVKKALGKDESIEDLTVLPLDGIPGSWEDLALLPSLQIIEIPQSAIQEDTVLPDPAYTVRLKGGGR